MKNFKLTIEYDGSRYNGWQRQGNTQNTIQAKIEHVLSQMTGIKEEIIGSSRTDAGVHALNQIANFKTNISLKPDEIRNYCNKYLPEDIIIKNVEEVAERFHARYNTKSKQYLYRIWNEQIPTAFLRKYTYHVPKQLNIKAMKQATKYFLGEHDFIAFSSIKSKKKSTTRQIYSIDILKNNAELNIIFHGNGFLYNMVRIMVGTLLEIGERKRSPENIKDILNSKVRANAGFTAPSHGLVLTEIYYE